MLNAKFIFALLLLLAVAAGNGAYCFTQKDSLLHILKKESKSRRYDQLKEARLRRIRSSLSNSASQSYQRRYQLYSRMLEEYIPYQFDSSYVYVKKMMEASEKEGDSYRLQESQLKTLHGKEAVGQYMAKAYVEPPRFGVENLIAEGDFVTTIGKISLKDDERLVHYSYYDV